MINYHIKLNLINIIKINYNRKKLFFIVKFHKKYYNLLKIFKYLSVISSFTIIYNQIKNIFCFKINLLYFKYQPLYNYIKSVIKTAPRYYISYQSLTLLNKRLGNSVYILQTQAGYMTHQQALKNKIGGRIIFFLSA